MIFNSVQFAVFFAAVLLLYRAPLRGRAGVLLGASLLFYTLWIPQYLLLLLVEIGVNYALLRAMARSTNARRAWISVQVVFTLSLLAYFKYADFLLGSLPSVLAQPFGERLPGSEIVLPLGISFFSFQIMALAVDVYRAQIAPPASLARYALFVCFFPQLIAGPILRGHEFLPQLERGGRFEPERTRRGVWLIGVGVAKKVILADFLLAPYVNDVFGAPGERTAPAHLVAMWAFAFQIYFDFSGYTDMARGLAALLGFELPMNFREPYLSRNPAEFWRRWHITLSQWLRDYLYIPLGGNRRGRARTGLNLMLTMLLGGLWHGAGWNFVVWGGLHGLFLAGHRLLAGERRLRDAPLRLRDAPQILLMFNGVCLLWIFFRAPDWESALAFCGGLIGSYSEPWPLLPTAVVALCVALHGVERAARPKLPQLRAALGGVAGGAVEGAALAAILVLAIFASGSGAEFIYFQF